MSIVLALVCAIAFVAIFRIPIQRHPAVFYVLALALDALLLVGQSIGMPVIVWRTVLSLHSRCLFAFALFAIVMFIGALKDGSKLKTLLLPIRAELSILATLLVVGHVWNYASVYIAKLASGTFGSDMIGACVAFALVAVLIPLAVTSIKAVKRRMDGKTWKRVQRFAYVFWGLVYAHVTFVLGFSAAAGGASAQESLAVYTILFALYLTCRFVRFATDRSATGKEQEARFVPSPTRSRAADENAASPSIEIGG